MDNMPTFLVIGAARSGTTALYTFLKQHPAVFMAPIKEPNFYAFEGEKLQCRGPGADYINNSITNLSAYKKLFAVAPIEMARGEASPLYLYSEKAPKQIRQHVPDAHLIAILRNPIEQAYSHFLYARRQVLEPLNDFMSALLAEENRKNDDWQPLFQYSQFPKYHQQLKRYYDVFPKAQIKIFLYEDLCEKPAEVLKEIFRFIDVDEQFSPNLSQHSNIGGNPKIGVLQNILMKPHASTKFVGSILPHSFRNWIREFVSSSNLSRPEMPQSAKDHLVRELENDINNLQHLIGRDLSAWLR